MGSSIYDDFDKQIISIQQVLTLSNNLKEKCLKLEDDKNRALGKCAELAAEIKRLSRKECPNCVILVRKLVNEKKEKEKLKKEAKEKLLKTIAKTLENMEDGNTDQMTNAQQFFTQLVCDSLDDGPQIERKKTVSLIQDSENSEDISDTKVLANETVMEIESGESSDCNPQCGLPVIIPETQLESCLLLEYNGGLNNQKNKNYNLLKKTENKSVLKENVLSSEEEENFQQVSKKTKRSPILTNSGARERSISLKAPVKPLHLDTDETVFNNQPAKSPSVLSEIIEAMGGSSNPRSYENRNAEEEKGTFWKMKPSNLESNAFTKGSGKKLKQMTLRVSRLEKRHDISLSEAFKGGVASDCGKADSEENDVILPSPEHLSRRNFNKKSAVCETMEDPDLTVFQPGVTSTCIPMETSFDRLPEVQKSPPYKYRRETVRKKVERMKLPGQDCDQCRKYYEAAGLDQSKDIRARMNTCSRHRDKYQIRSNTPPGFWNPVISDSPEGC